MTDQKLFKIIAYYETELPAVSVLNLDIPAEQLGARAHLDHIVNDMLPQMRVLVAEARREKLMRWLGYVQGVLVVLGVFTLDEVKAHNMPDAS